MEKTKFKFVVPIGIKAACLLYKLMHAFEYLQCNENFAIRKSTIHLILQGFVYM
jgi:hypothetical protein